MCTQTLTKDFSQDEIIRILDLKPLPVEGGYFRPTYRGDLRLGTDALPPGFPSARQITSAIYYFLTADTKSRLHRLRTDEMWHFYLGDPVTIHIFRLGHGYTKTLLGQNLLQGQAVQAVVPAHSFFGAHLQPGGQWALMGCTLSPEYRNEDFSLPSLEEFEELLGSFPQQQETLQRLR